MNKLIIIMVCNLCALYTWSQTSNSNIDKWKNNATFSIFLQEDLSNAFYYKNDSYLGVFGKNNYKINIRFDTIVKGSPTKYEIIGKSLLKNKSCEFTGVLEIERIELFFINNLKMEVVLLAVGEYELKESSADGGEFIGVFRKYFVYSLKDGTISPYVDYDFEFEEGYAGIWKNYSDTYTYPCNFGFFRYPKKLVPNFEIGYVEPRINPIYRNNGWESFFIEGYSYYSNIETENTWWKK